MQNKANFPRLGWNRCRLPRPCSLAALGTSAPNKPNCAQASGEPSILQESSYDELDAQKVSAKQSQFLDCGLRIGDFGLGTDLRRDAGLAAYRPPPGEDKMCKTNPISATGADHAKQSQFPAVPGGRGPGDEGRAGQSCKTNPIWPPVSGNGRAGRPRGPRPTVDYAKRTQFLPAEPIARNEANSRRR
jgi:hypothetical protein